MNYISYEEYTEMGGDLIPQADFNKIAKNMSRKVDGLTFNRIAAIGFDKLSPFQQKTVKEAMMALCDFEYDNSDILNSSISSYTLNGVSMSFGNSQGGVTVDGLMISKNGYQLLTQTGLTCRLI